MAVTDYSTTPGSNTAISSINIAEGCAPANINDAIRQMMADIATWRTVSGTLFTGGGTFTGSYTYSNTVTFTVAPVFTDAAGTRTALGATTVGGNLLTLANPSAVTFPRINADNTVTARTAVQLLGDIGGAASGANTDITSLAQGTTVNEASGTAAANSLGFRGAPQVTFTASKTLALTDAGKQQYITGTTAAQTITIPANGSVAFPIGTIIPILNDSNQNWSIAITTDTLLWTPSGGTGTRTLAASGFATLQKVTATRWWISGTGLS